MIQLNQIEKETSKDEIESCAQKQKGEILENNNNIN